MHEHRVLVMRDPPHSRPDAFHHHRQNRLPENRPSQVVRAVQSSLGLRQSGAGSCRALQERRGAHRPAQGRGVQGPVPVHDRVVVRNRRATPRASLQHPRRGDQGDRLEPEDAGDLQHPLGLCEEPLGGRRPLRHAGQHCGPGAHDLDVQVPGALQHRLGLRDRGHPAPDPLREDRVGRHPEAVRHAPPEHRKHPLVLREVAGHPALEHVPRAARGGVHEALAVQAAGALHGDLGRGSGVSEQWRVLRRGHEGLLPQAQGVLAERGGQPHEGPLRGSDDGPAGLPGDPLRGRPTPVAVRPGRALHPAPRRARRHVQPRDLRAPPGALGARLRDLPAAPAADPQAASR
mmetsp:Transcript_22052/g.65753  ORF Transcript_22052/g.65753 Transcript_22052/m.65753 type:complete len:347 (+) Transcript_22052:812-1852(+)